MLPEVDGISICKEHRRDSDTPIIMVTAKVEEIDRLLGLELGADENTLVLDEERFTVTYNQTNLNLTAIEFKLLHSLYKHEGKILSRDQLMTHSYSDNRIVSDRTIDSHVKKLRQKLVSFDLEEDLIQSVYGVGYRYNGIS